MKVTKNLRKKLIYLALAIIFIVLLLPSTLFVDKNYSTVILDENNKILRIFLNKEEKWYLKNEEIKPIPDKLKKLLLTLKNNGKSRRIEEKFRIKVLYNEQLTLLFESKIT